MSIEQIQKSTEEEPLESEIAGEMTQEQAESIFGKALKCFKKWTNLGITVVSVYVVGEKLIESENDINLYRDSVAATLSAEDLKIKNEGDKQIQAVFGEQVVKSIFFGDMHAYFERQAGTRLEPEIIGFDDAFARYGITENYLLYPKGWINGEFGSVEFIDKEHKKKAGAFTRFLSSQSVLIYRNRADREYDSVVAPIQNGVFEHEFAHANDWETDMDLNILERQQLLLSIYGRLTTSDKYQSDYYSSFIDGTPEGLYKSAKEYWAEICGEYFTNPQSFLEKHPVDFALVDEYAKKNDPSFDIFNKDRGAFDTQTGKMKDVWVGK